MALFTVNRYTGQDDMSTPDKSRAAAILENLKHSAKLKKQQIQGKQQIKDKTQDKTKKKISGKSSGANQTVTGIDSSASDSPKLQTRTCNNNKKTSVSDLSESSDIVCNDTNCMPSKKTRKHKLKECDIEEKVSPRKKRKQTSVHSNPETFEAGHASDIVESSNVQGEKIEESEVDYRVFNMTASDDEGNSENDADSERFKNDSSSQDVGGFTVIGSTKGKKLRKVERVLPDWLSNPSVIVADVNDKSTTVQSLPGLSRNLKDRLEENGIMHFFPVQKQLIPALLDSVKTGFYIGRSGYKPSDICCSAPTGSGKTLAFALPIIQALQERVVCQVRALIVLPVRDLATQVYNVFKEYCKGTKLNVVLVTGQKTFAVEQKRLIKQRIRGPQSLADIVVSTPGRLVDHINMTSGFSLQHLRFLVIDEADRMMDEIKQDWLAQVENAAYKGRSKPGPITVANSSIMETPLQKLLFSATLSQNPEKLQQLNLFQPKLFTSVVKSDKEGKVMKADEFCGDGSTSQSGSQAVADENSHGEFVGKYTTPKGLMEYFVMSSLNEKPLSLLYFLHQLKFRQVLCFAKSVDSTHRLCMLIKLFGGLEVREFSSGLPAAARSRVLKQFAAGKIDILICSDVMARGMDIDNVKYVISYDSPHYIKNYIHRVGRTARAGRAGTAVTLLEKKEIYHFKQLMKSAGKTGIKELKVSKLDLKPLVPQYEKALAKLPHVLK